MDQDHIMHEHEIPILQMDWCAICIPHLHIIFVNDTNLAPFLDGHNEIKQQHINIHVA